MTSSKITREPNPTDRQTVKELFYTSPMVERGKPILVELKWVLLGRQNAEQHIKILPEYCYHIFDVFQKTYFKGFPLFHETVFIIDQAGFKAAKTIDEAKKVLKRVATEGPVEPTTVSAGN